MRMIGRDRREAITWAQDLMQSDRPFAEDGVYALLETNLLKITPEGAMLSEDVDEEMLKKQAHIFNQTKMKKMSRNRIRRNHKHTHRKLMRHDFSDVADAMIFNYGDSSEETE